MALLFILVCGVALLQSRLIKAAGHWTQHGASAIQLNNSRNMSRTCTSAAELFYLRHTRSCAATACGNKGGGTSHSTPLQMSGADFIARLLQSILRRCYLTVLLPLVVHAADLVQDHNALLKSMHILGECIHPEERNAPLHVDT